MQTPPKNRKFEKSLGLYGKTQNFVRHELLNAQVSIEIYLKKLTARITALEGA